MALVGFTDVPVLLDVADSLKDGSAATRHGGETVCAASASTASSEHAFDSADDEPRNFTTAAHKNKAQQPTLHSNGAQLSAGSAGHAAGQCVPCAFYCFKKQGCAQGTDCGFCHLFHVSNKKLRQKEWLKRQQEKQGRQQRRLHKKVADELQKFDPTEEVGELLGTQSWDAEQRSPAPRQNAALNTQQVPNDQPVVRHAVTSRRFAFLPGEPCFVPKPDFVSVWQSIRSSTGTPPGEPCFISVSATGRAITKAW